jgi:hypothetical protein
MIKIKHILILTLVYLTIDCYGDEPRQQFEFKSSNGKYLLKISKTRVDTFRNDYGAYPYHTELKWGLFNTSDNELIYEIPGPISQKQAYISNNGEMIVVINDWPPEQADDSLELIMIYKNGDLIKKYKLSDLLSCGYNISSSVSHFDWSWGEIEVKFLTNTIDFRTLELVDYKIDILNGEIISKKLDSKIQDSSIVAYGKVFEDKNGKYRLEVCHRVYGQIDSTGFVLFDSDYKYHGGWYYTVLINNGKEERLRQGLSDIHDLKYNSCVYEFEGLGKDFHPIGFGNINCN